MWIGLFMLLRMGVSGLEWLAMVDSWCYQHLPKTILALETITAQSASTFRDLEMIKIRLIKALTL